MGPGFFFHYRNSGLPKVGVPALAGLLRLCESWQSRSAFDESVGYSERQGGMAAELLIWSWVNHPCRFIPAHPPPLKSNGIHFIETTETMKRVKAWQPLS
jgi:hypothetical protein